MWNIRGDMDISAATAVVMTVSTSRELHNTAATERRSLRVAAAAVTTSTTRTTTITSTTEKEKEEKRRGGENHSSFWWSCLGGVRSTVAAAAGILGRALASLLLLRYYKKPLYQLARLPVIFLRYIGETICRSIGSSDKKIAGQHRGASSAHCCGRGGVPATAAAAAAGGGGGGGRGGGKALAGSSPLPLLQQQQRRHKQQQQQQDRSRGTHGRSRSSTSSSTSSSQHLLADISLPEEAAAAAVPPPSSASPSPPPPSPSPSPSPAAEAKGGGEKKAAAAPQQRHRRHPCAGCRRRSSNNNPPGSFPARHSQDLLNFRDDLRDWEFTGTSLISHRASLLKAKTYEEYSRLALIMDRLTGRERWKYELESSLYDYEAVGKRVKALQKARRSGRVEELQEALCASMRDQMLGIFKEKLYSRTYIGTKQQIELFIDEVCGCLTDLQQHVPTHAFEIAKTVQQLQSLWGVTGLVLSGGASLGLHHFGVLEVLLKTQVNGKNFIPKVVGGCSAGAVVAAWLCTRTDEELLRQGNAEYLSEYWQGLSPNSWLLRLWNVLTKGYMCDMDVWRAAAKKLFGDLTFLEAYRRTGRVLNISMTRADREEAGVKVMNYANAPNVLIWSALLCSCAFPFLSLPMPLREKNERGEAIISKSFGCSYFHDGSLSGDIPTEQIRDAWGVSYSIVSQVNLHVFPFAGLRTHGEAGIPVHWRGRSSRWRAGFLLSALELFFKEHIRFLLRLIALLDVSPTLRGINAGSLALQSYTGDVTLHPRYISPRYLRLLNDSSPSDIRWYLQEGRLMVFPKLHLISNRMRVDRCLENLRIAVHRACSQERRSE